MIAYNSSSTGTSDTITFDAPVTKVSVQPSGACTYLVQGSLNGDTWATVIASSTSAAGALKTSTGNFVITHARVTFSAIGTTTFTCQVVGA